MAHIKAFQGVRPRPDIVEKVAALPYDVISSEEAKIAAAGNPYSFYHISKPEIDLPSDIDPYSPAVYEKGKEALHVFIKEGILRKDPRENLYLYTQIMDGRSQTGLVACVNIDDYLNGTVKKHELTREDKELDRTRHLDIVNANTGPVFLMYHEDGSKRELLQKTLSIAPIYDFTAADGIRHIVRIIDDATVQKQLIDAFSNDILYIADGHHRAASAVRVGMNRRKELPSYTGNEEFNWFLAVIFPHDQLMIMPYNRVVKDLNGMSSADFMQRLQTAYSITPSGKKMPDQIHQISLYLDHQWYLLTPTFTIPDDPINNLDVKIVQDTILDTLLGITNPRSDKRIDFIGGIRGTGELERLVDSGEYAVAFSLYPTTVQQLMKVSDADQIMPPKSTWFEPKLRSGLLLHQL